MAEIHLFQWTAAFIAALYITFKWILMRPNSRWRHIVIGLITTPLWFIVGYTAGNVGVADGGETIAFGSEALGMFATFMVVASVEIWLLGLLLWVEEEAEETHRSLPNDMQHRPRRGD